MKHLYGSVFSGALLASLMAVPILCDAQPMQPPSRAEAQAALNPAPTRFTRAQLDQMLAPIALYPDQLLSQLLMAATLPQQVVDAGKWLQDSNNAALKGDDLVAALQPLPWDPSVKSLVAFPQIIAMMNDHLDWTETLGTAFANQQVETMARVQFLRDRAVAAGRLKSTPQLAVHQDGDEIVIEPVDPSMVYVPVYDPAQAYGEWPDSDAPPVYIPPPPNFYSGEIGAAIGFSVGFGVVAPLWGWSHPDWRHHEVAVDSRRFNQITAPNNRPNNQTIIQNNTWHRAAPVALVPQAQRPLPPSPPNTAPPAGTVRSGVVAQPLLHSGPTPSATTTTPPPHSGGPPHSPPSGLTTTSPPGQTTAPAPHPGETPHPPPGQSTGAPTGMAPQSPHPGETPHPPPSGLTQTPMPHPGEMPHPPPGQAIAAPPHQAETPHPPPHPAPSPAAAAPAPPPVPHPPPPTPAAASAPPPHPAPPPSAHPGPPPQAPAAHSPSPPPGQHPPNEKKPQPKPGEEQNSPH